MKNKTLQPENHNVFDAERRRRLMSSLPPQMPLETNTTENIVSILPHDVMW